MPRWRRADLLEMGQGQRTSMTRMRNASLTRPHRRFDGSRQGAVRLEIRATDHDIKSTLTPSDGRCPIDLRSTQHSP